MAVKTASDLTLGEVLMSENLITQEDYEKSMAEQKKGNTTFARAIVSSGAVNEGVKLGVLQKKMNIPVASLANTKLAPMAADRIPRELCEQLHAVAWKLEGESLCVAMEDPTDKTVIEAITNVADLPIKVFAAKSIEITELIKQIPKKEEVSKAARKPSKLLGLIFLITFSFVPIIGSLALYILVDDINQVVQELIKEPFERGLAFFLVAALWASLVYFIHGMLFGSEEEEPDYVP